MTSGDLYQRLQAEREARQAAKDAQTAPADVATVGSSLLGPALLIGLAVVGVLIFTRKK